MQFKDLKKYLPTKEKLSQQAIFSPIRQHIFHPDLWNFNRRSLCNGVFIGLACAFIPLPGQMFIAALFAILTRSNLPIAVAGVWITNPLTFGPIFYFAYRLGAWLLDTELATNNFGNSLEWFLHRFYQIWQPLLLGCALCSWTAGTIGLAISRLLWRIHIIQLWKTRAWKRKSKRKRTLDP